MSWWWWLAGCICICLGCSWDKSSWARTNWSAECRRYCWHSHNSLLRWRCRHCRFRPGINQGVRIFLRAEYSHHLRLLIAGAIWWAAVKLQARKWEFIVEKKQDISGDNAALKQNDRNHRRSRYISILGYLVRAFHCRIFHRHIFFYVLSLLFQLTSELTVTHVTRHAAWATYRFKRYFIRLPFINDAHCKRHAVRTTRANTKSN